MVDAVEKVIEVINDTLKKEVSFNYTFENGEIDSISMIRIIVELEDVFGIEFSDDDLDYSNYSNVEDIVNAVKRGFDTNSA